MGISPGRSGFFVISNENVNKESVLSANSDRLGHVFGSENHEMRKDKQWRKSLDCTGVMGKSMCLHVLPFHNSNDDLAAGAAWFDTRGRGARRIIFSMVVAA